MNEFEILKWMATAFIVVSALQVSLNINWASKWWAYVGFTLGRIAWSYFAYIMQDWPLLGLNASFICIDIYAMYIRRYKQTNNKQ